MAYFIVEFSYTGPRVNIISDNKATDDASDALIAADQLVMDKLQLEQGIQCKHAYSWPDGSLYKYVKTDLEQEQLTQLLNRVFEGSGIQVTSVAANQPGDDPMKHGCRTLDEYFASDWKVLKK